MFDTLSYHINSLELQTEAKPYLAVLKRSLGLSAHWASSTARASVHREGIHRLGR